MVVPAAASRMVKLLKTLRSRHRGGHIGGQVAVCSIHPQVLQAAARQAQKDQSLLLVETTAHQVNRCGGYSGMTPVDFAGSLQRLAAEHGLAPGRVLLGADHLGPHPWRHLPSHQAMAQAEALVQAVVMAGYHKLHLDTARSCVDDPQGGVPPEVASRRAAALCRAAESTALQAGTAPPLYVIGTEVPAPGGSLAASGAIAITEPQDLQDELHHYRNAFRRAGVAQVWERVVAVVVQPGVDFDDHRTATYQPAAAAALSAFHDQLPDPMTFEVHAADYQSPAALTHLVRDHFTLLKVGPCLTFALREALMALAHIEDALPGLTNRSNLIAVMEQLMLKDPQHWRRHYRGSAAELRYLRHYSLRDRIRYYWSDAHARQACETLITNLQRPIPRALLRQFLPDLDDAVSSAALTPTPQAIIQRRIQAALQPYSQACRNRTKAQ
jgi:D-tagatose-1,6-bisphosphate aldolase subunit GatZ/KbaZ